MNFFKIVVFVIVFSLFPNFLFSQDDVDVKVISQGNIFKENTFKSCHASTVIELRNHTIMAAWFAGEFEGSKDVNIWTSILENGKWSVPKCVANGVQNDTLRYACWNPVLFRNKDNKLFLFYKVGLNPRQWWGEMKVSTDDGNNWKPSKKLPEGFLGPIKNKPIVLKSGKILFPSSTESVTGDIWKIHLESTNSSVNHWKKIEIENVDFGLIQPTILEYSDNKLQMLCRSKQNVIVSTWSSDEGDTWTRPEALKLPNPNSGIDAVSLKNGLQLLVYNPMISGKDWWLGRSELRLAVSKNGKDWKDIYTLENHENGEYSYPAIIQSSNGLIHITYTDNRKNIRYVSVNISQKK